LILKNKFNHYNNKYELDELLKCILIILKTGISYRNINTYTSINWWVSYSICYANRIMKPMGLKEF